MPASSSVPDASEVTRHLERILGHPLFQSSRRLSEFLRFVVETTISNRAEQLKEYVIGVEVFERGQAYDPREDPIVRIMAGRLRSRLAEYYLGSGRDDRLIIELPRGGYMPRFVWRQPGSPETSVTGRGPHCPRPSRISVGRAQELKRLHAAFSTVLQGSGFMLTISGDAGLGKTTIVEDFLDGIEAQFGPVWLGRGRCSERLSEADAFVPILESLEGLRRDGSGDEIDLLMRSAAPSWRALLAPPDDRGAEGVVQERKTGSHDRMRREFIRFLEELSRIRPVVLFLDDLHWADTSTCDLLAYVGSRMGSLRILILTTFRPAAVMQKHAFLPLKLELERREVCEEVGLSLLTPDDIGRYLSLRYPSNSFPAEFERMVHARTEGNPLFMAELLRFLQDREILAQQDGVWRLMRSLNEISTLIPAGIQSMIRLKIDQLAGDQRQALFCAAVQGMEFDSAVIARVLSLDPADVEELLQELESTHPFLTRAGERNFSNRGLSVRYRFVHVFYQNVLYESVPPSRRATWSAAIARALVSLAGEASRAMAVDLAILFECGRDFDMAAQYFLEAARNSARVFAYPEAVILCERGLGALMTLAESHERDARELQFSVILGLSLMVNRGYAAPEVERTHRRSRELCIRLNDARRLMPVLWSIHTCEINAGRLQPALEVAQEMREIAETLTEPFARIESLHALGTTLAFMGRVVEARRALEAILEGDPAGRPFFPHSLYVMDPYVTSLSMLARLLTLMGRADEAVAKAAASVELASRLAHLPSLVYADFWVGWIAHTLGRYSEACRHLESTMTLSRTHGLPQILEWARVVRGSALAHTDRLAEGVSEIRISLDHQAAMRALVERPYCLTLLAEGLRRQGAHEESLELCDEALALGSRTAAGGYTSETHRVRGEVLLSLGRPPSEAQSEFEEALRLSGEDGCRLLELRAAMSLFRLGEANMRARLAEIAGWFQDVGDFPILAEARHLLGVTGPENSKERSGQSGG